MKLFVTRCRLKEWLGPHLEEHAIKIEDDSPQTEFLAYQVLKEPGEFVAVVQKNGKLLAVVDRLQLASQIAKIELERHINQVLKQASAGS